MIATLIDFDDSFTFNVLQQLEEAGLTTSVLSWRDFEDLPEKGILVLGPGPGHPDDYQSHFPLLREWLKQKRPFFGVCLGHQIFWRLQGEEVLRSKHPLHGQRVRLDLDAEWRAWLELGADADVRVQRYNSLAVMEEARIRNPYLRNFVQNDEILITAGENVITYQFHPESVGTTFRRAFMRPLLRDLV